MTGFTWQEPTGGRGVPMCEKVSVKASEVVGRGIECELGRVQGSRIGVSGGARTK